MKEKIQTLLKKQAYQQVKETLQNQNIDINEVTDDDIETLVADKLKDMQSHMKGFAFGGVFTTVFTLLIL